MDRHGVVTPNFEFSAADTQKELPIIYNDQEHPDQAQPRRVEPEITARVLKRGRRLYELPIVYHGRSYAEGKKITMSDGIVALLTLLNYRLMD